MKAMLLAAGSGKRLRPFTEECPKPLLPVGRETLIERHIRKLAEAGFTDIVINVAYLAEKIQDALGLGARWGVSIHYSLEPEGGLETGGGIIEALPLLTSEYFAVISSDIWTDYDYNALRCPPKGLGHLVLVDNPYYKPLGDFCLDSGVVSLETPRPLTFANLGVYRWELFSQEPQGYQALGPILRRASGAHQLTGECYRGIWFNVGTHQEWEAAQRYVEQSR